jgi:hypothetical protein
MFARMVMPVVPACAMERLGRDDASFYRDGGECTNPGFGGGSGVERCFYSEGGGRLMTWDT